MATLKELNIKLASFKQTKKITSAMKLIATTRFNKMQLVTRRSQKYLAALETMAAVLGERSETLAELGSLAAGRAQSAKHRQAVQLLVFTSERGLCGSFNQAVIKRFQSLLTELRDVDCYVDFIGRRGYDAFKNVSQFKERRELEGLTKQPRYDDMLPHADRYLNLLSSGARQKLIVVYNEFISTLVQRPIVRTLVPLQENASKAPPPAQHQKTVAGGAAASNAADIADAAAVCLLEPAAAELAEAYLKALLRFNLYQTLLQSVTGEHAARMTAMDNATRNCNELVDQLTLERNRVRQAAITTELIEIISGAEAAQLS